MLSVKNLTLINTLKSDINVTQKVYGDCMNPTLKNGELVTISPIKKQTEISAGKIVLFKTKDNRLLLHRIIKIENNQVITKSDKYYTEDDPINISDILGITTKIHVNPVRMYIRKCLRILQIGKQTIRKNLWFYPKT